VTTPRFIIYFLLFNIALAIAPWVAQTVYSANNMLIPGFWGLFAVFSIITLNIYLIASWQMRISNKASGQALLGSVAVKFLICMVIVLVYLIKNTVDPILFLLNFFYLYFFHTVFEIYCFLRNLRNQNLK
jgi:hypothetical protein